MSAEIMLSFLKTCGPNRRLGFQVAAQCGPVLKNVKISNLMAARPGSWYQILIELEKSRIVCIPLYADEAREILFLYRYAQLESHLKRSRVRRLLRCFGYEEYEVVAVLRRLGERYRQYGEQNGPFPHELGVLLEYPVEDVEGFIANQGKNSLTSRYWKVYHDRKEAERIFHLYDEVREKAMWEIVQGFSLCQVAI